MLSTVPVIPLGLVRKWKASRRFINETDKLPSQSPSIVRTATGDGGLAAGSAAAGWTASNEVMAAIDARILNMTSPVIRARY